MDIYWNRCTSDEHEIKKSLSFVIGYNPCDSTSSMKSLDIEY
jgi:hypothetical protein